MKFKKFIYIVFDIKCSEIHDFFIIYVKFLGKGSVVRSLSTSCDRPYCGRRNVVVQKVNVIKLWTEKSKFQIHWIICANTIWNVIQTLQVVHAVVCSIRPTESIGITAFHGLDFFLWKLRFLVRYFKYTYIICMFSQ